MAEKTHIVFINDKLGKRNLVLPGGRRRTIRHLEELESNDPIIELYPSLVIKREKTTDAKQEKELLVDEAKVDESEDESEETEDAEQEKELLVEEPVGEAKVDESEDESEETEDAEPKPHPLEIAEVFKVKDDLDMWAEENFNIKLDKRRSLEKMKEEFAEKLNS